MLINNELYIKKLQEAERLKAVEDAIEKICRDFGFASFKTYMDMVQRFNAEQPINTPRKPGRPGYHGPAHSATDEDLARAAEMDKNKESLVKISETLCLSYQTCLKWRKRKWKRS